jgi:hypothetical protein
MSPFQRFLTKVRIFIRSKLFLNYQTSKNYLSLLSAFVEKNRHFIGEQYNFDLFKIVRGEIDDIKLLL